MNAARLTAIAVIGTLLAGVSWGQNAPNIATIDHYVRAKSAVPAISGQWSSLYVRERVDPGVALRSANFTDRVVLFVHGAGTPSEVAFDVPYQDYSWMAYVAQAGFDVFSVDMTGYGRSTRPPAMNDPCNLSNEQQQTFVPSLISAACQPSYSQQMTTIASDWNDVGAAVDYIRALRHIDRVSLVAWSQGGPRAGGYAAAHPEKVSKLILLAPAYSRMGSATAPQTVPASGAAFNTQTRAEFVANWDRQVACPAQYEPNVLDSVWSQLLASDPVGATWGAGVRRAPWTTTWGLNQAVVSKMTVPTLLVAGIFDKQVPPERVREMHADMGSKQKVMIDLGCSSHAAMWEKNHNLLFRASVEWLTKTTVDGKQEGILRMGYPE